MVRGVDVADQRVQEGAAKNWADNIPGTHFSCDIPVGWSAKSPNVPGLPLLAPARFIGADPGARWKLALVRQARSARPLRYRWDDPGPFHC